MEKPCLLSEDKAKCFILNIAFIRSEGRKSLISFFILTVEFSCLSQEEMFMSA